MPARPIFIARNGHSPKMGTPPAVVPPASEYDVRGYHEGRFGDQWIFQYDAQTNEVVVRSGDHGWDQVFTVMPFEDVLGHVEGADGAMIRDLYGDWLLMGEDGSHLIGKPEQAWLAGCMQVVDARREAMGITRTLPIGN